jgi:hypothetical protein
MVARTLNHASALIPTSPMVNLTLTALRRDNRINQSYLVRKLQLHDFTILHANRRVLTSLGYNAPQ